MRFILILSVLLSGCASGPVRDGYVKVQWHRTTDAYAEARKLGLNVTPMQVGINGFKYFDGEVCHVFAPDPKMKEINGKVDYENGQWGTLGHEVKHCFDGAFH